MKIQEYIEKHKLHRKFFDYDKFIEDFDNDFMAIINLRKKGSWNKTQFFNTVKEMRQKFENIFRKAKRDIPEKLWGFFYAKHIVNLGMQENFMQRKEKKE